MFLFVFLLRRLVMEEERRRLLRNSLRPLASLAGCVVEEERIGGSPVKDGALFGKRSVRAGLDESV